MICLELFWAFFKIGAFTFGGGYAMLPLIQAEVERHGWMMASELVNFVAVSESTPGPLAVNIATYVGMELAGLPGALCSTVGVVLPSFLVILIVARCFERFRQSRLVKGCMSGLKPAVVGLIGAAMISVSKTVFLPEGAAAWSASPEFWVSAGILILSLGMAVKKVHPILIILSSAALGIGGGFLL